MGRKSDGSHAVPASFSDKDHYGYRPNVAGASDTLGTYFPDAPQPLKSITVRELSSHLSGIPMTPLNVSAATFSDAVKSAESLNLQWEPGTKTGYVSDDYILLRALMEKAGGEPCICGGRLLLDRRLG